jgi:hypothetical protein
MSRPTLQVVDELGHDCPNTTEFLRRQLLGWLDLEEMVGDLSPALRELRDRLREEQDDC